MALPRASVFEGALAVVLTALLLGTLSCAQALTAYKVSGSKVFDGIYTPPESPLPLIVNAHPCFFRQAEGRPVGVGIFLFWNNAPSGLLPPHHQKGWSFDYTMTGPDGVPNSGNVPNSALYNPCKVGSAPAPDQAPASGWFSTGSTGLQTITITAELMVTASSAEGNSTTASSKSGTAHRLSSPTAVANASAQVDFCNILFWDKPFFASVCSMIPETIAGKSGEAVEEFYHKYVEGMIKPRQNTEVDVSPEDVRSGDLLLTFTRNSSFNLVIASISGAPVGHVAMALWDGPDGMPGSTLYIVETALEEIRVVPFKSDLAEYRGNNSAVVWVRPAMPGSQAFDRTAAWAKLRSLGKLPYGLPILVAAGLDKDCKLPDHVRNKPTHGGADAPVGDIFDRVKELVREAFLDPLNKRFLHNHNYTTTCDLSLSSALCVPKRLSELQMTLLELWAEPEQDAWRYDLAPRSDVPALVCSSLAMTLLEAGGVFRGKEEVRRGVNFVEFTPKDVAQLQIFNSTWRPKACRPAGERQRPWCQLMGDVEIDLDRVGFNSALMTPHMNERCAVKPTAARPVGGR